MGFQYCIEIKTSVIVNRLRKTKEECCFDFTFFSIRYEVKIEVSTNNHSKIVQFNSS